MWVKSRNGSKGTGVNTGLMMKLPRLDTTNVYPSGDARATCSVIPAHNTDAMRSIRMLLRLLRLPHGFSLTFGP